MTAMFGLQAVVNLGVVMGALNRRVRPLGTFFAPNPSSENYCTLGGMLANNSSGSRSVAYGAVWARLAGAQLFTIPQCKPERTEPRALHHKFTKDFPATAV